MDTINVTLPNGKVIRNIPRGTPKDEIRRKAVAAGIITDAEFGEAVAKGFEAKAPAPGFVPPATPLMMKEGETPQDSYRSVPTEQEVAPYEGDASILTRAKVALRPVAEEASRSFWGGLVLPAAQFVVEASNHAQNLLSGGRGPTQEQVEKQQAALMRMMETISTRNAESGGRVFDNPDDITAYTVVNDGEKKHLFEMSEDGRVTTDAPETFVGQMLPFLVPIVPSYKGIVALKSLSKLRPALRVGIASAGSTTLSTQMLVDPNAENIANILNDTLSDGSKNTLLSYLASDEEDPLYVNRLRLTAQDAILGTLMGGGIWGTASVARWAKGSANSAVKNAVENGLESLPPDELGEVWYETAKHYRRSSRQTADVPTGPDGKPLYREDGSPMYIFRDGERTGDGAGVFATNPPRWSDTNMGVLTPDEFSARGASAAGSPYTRTMGGAGETEEGMRQIVSQAQAGALPSLQRFFRQIGTTRGYMTPIMDRLSRESQASRRALAARADHIANRINISIDRLARDAADPSNPFNIPDVTDPLAASSWLQDQASKALKGNQSALRRLPEGLRNEINESRELIDSLSQYLIDSPTVYEAFKDDVAGNLGSYLRRSYEIFENPRYVPDRDPAVQYFQREFLRDNPNIGVDDALQMASDRVDGILADARQGYATFLSSSHRLNNAIYKQKNMELPPAYRQLLGEVTNPGDQVRLTVQRLANYTQTDRFLRQFQENGVGTYLRSADEGPSGVFSQVISGTNSNLDGMYTSPQLVTALRNQESLFVNLTEDTGLNSVIRALTGYKAASQTAKTVLSHATHFKNFFGGTMTRLANGSLPFTEGTQALRVVWGNITATGDKALNDQAEKYLRLGVIDTSPSARELRELIDAGLGDTSRFGDWIVQQGNKQGEAIGNIVERGVDAVEGAMGKAQSVYMGTDDFFKIAEFETYLDVLKKEFPDTAVDILEEQAANVIKRTMFNYDMVPKGIKQLRYMPFGNFVGFPAEVMRTTFTIPKVAMEEISSGSEALAARGYRRMIGWASTVLGGGDLISHTSSMQAGVTPEEADALQLAMQTPYSKHPINWVARDADTGEFVVMDATTLDTYEYFKSGARALISEVANGTATNETVDKILVDAVTGFLSGYLAPFLSQSMVTEEVSDFIYALQSEDGRGLSGTMYFPEGVTPFNGISEGIQAFLTPLIPGSAVSAEKLYTESTNDIREWMGEPTDPDLAYLSQIGLSFRRVRPEVTTQFAARDYTNAVRDAPRVAINYYTPSSEVISAYTTYNRELYKAQQQLYKKANTARTLGMEWSQVHSLLVDSGVDPSVASGVLSGRFSPARISEALDNNVLTKMYAPGHEPREMTRDQLMTELGKVQDFMSFTSLGEFENTPGGRIGSGRSESVDEQRRPFSKGGVVVPNAPTFPSQRVDKLTGLPYSLQAGQPAAEGTLMEALKVPRQGFQAGGVVKALAKRFLKQADEVVEATSPPPSRPVERPATTVAHSPEYQEGVEKFGEEGMTTEARMARGDAMNMDPVPYYHGTAADFEAFSNNFLGGMTGADSAKMGFFFSRSPRTAGTYADWAGRKAEQGALLDGEEAATAGANVLPVRLRMERPKLVEMNFTAHDTPKRPRLSEEIAKAKEEGYDSVVFRNFSDHVDVKDINARMIEFLDQMPEDRFSEDTRKLVDWVVGNPKDLSYWRFDKLNAVIGDLSGAARRGQENFDAWYRDEGLFKRNGITTPEQAQKLYEDLSALKKELSDKYMDYTDHIVVFDPSQIRSVNATFDPAHRESGNLLRATTIAPAGGILEALRQASQLGSEEDI